MGKRVKLAPGTTRKREVLKIADEYLRHIKQSLDSIGSAINTTTYVNDTYIWVVLSLMPTSTHPLPGCDQQLRDAQFRYVLLAGPLSTVQLQRYLSAMTSSKLVHQSQDKIRDLLSSILGSAVRYQLLVKRSMEGVQLAPNRIRKE